MQEEKKLSYLECCVDSTESAIAAVKGKADRLEICADLCIGGTTPTVAMVRQISELIERMGRTVEKRVLIRPRFGDFCFSELEVDQMCMELQELLSAGADGIVIGALMPDGRLDMTTMSRMIKAAEESGCRKVTLHRAFDMSRDAFETLEDVCKLNERSDRVNIDTILTSGQNRTALDGSRLIRELKVRALEYGINIMAGAGVTPDNIRGLIEYTGAGWFHMSAKKVVDSKMIYRNDRVSMGLKAMSEYDIWRTDEKALLRARAIVDEMNR